MNQLTSMQIEEIREVNRLVMSRDRWGSVYEYLTFLLYYTVLRRNDTAVDCGVNVGDHTLVMAKLCRPGFVFSLEAAPEMLARAKAATADFDNIHYIQKAAWERSGETKQFHYFPQQDGLSGLHARSGTTVEKLYDVETVTLDDAVDAAPVLIKLDIEGAEYHALRGAHRLMTVHKPIIVFENGRGTSAERYGYDKNDFFSLFWDRGYTVYSISGMPFVPELWEDTGCPWQFVAVHPASSRSARALSALNWFTANLR